MSHPLDTVPAQVAFHLGDLHGLIEAIGAEAGLGGRNCCTVEDILQALPGFYRRRVVLALQSRKAFSTDPNLQAACTILLDRAANLWARCEAAPVLPAGPSQTHSLDSEQAIAAKAPTE